MKNGEPKAKRQSGRFWQRYFDQWFQTKKSPIDESVPLLSTVKNEIAGFWHSIGSISKALGEYRDALLLGAGALYLLGYLTWALYGLFNGIGFIPVLDLQYFAAGIVPALLILASLFIIKLLGALKAWLQYPPTRAQLTVARGAATGGSVVIPIAILFFFTGPSEWGELTMLLGLVLVYLSHMLARNRGSRLLQGILLWSARAYTLLILVLWVVYVREIMPSVPTEWGGAKSRCIMLDVDSGQLSPETRALILDGNVVNDKSGILRTRMLTLIFEGGEYLFLTKRDGRASALNPVYRLRKDAVRAVFSCPPSP